MGIYLCEIQQYLHTQTRTEVDIGTILCHFLHASGFTQQKLASTAKQRSELLRAQYLIKMQVYLGHPELLVFIDETGADNQDYMRRFGYSLCGSLPELKNCFGGLLSTQTTICSHKMWPSCHVRSSSRAQRRGGVGAGSIQCIHAMPVYLLATCKLTLQQLQVRMRNAWNGAMLGMVQTFADSL